MDDLLAKPADRFDPQRQREVLARVAAGLTARRLTAPAIFVLESSLPLTYVASQALVLLQPFVQAVIGIRDYEVFAAALENRDNVEWLIQQLEAAEECRGRESTESTADTEVKSAQGERAEGTAGQQR